MSGFTLPTRRRDMIWLARCMDSASSPLCSAYACPVVSYPCVRWPAPATMHATCSFLSASSARSAHLPAFQRSMCGCRPPRRPWRPVPLRPVAPLHQREQQQAPAPPASHTASQAPDCLACQRGSQRCQRRQGRPTDPDRGERRMQSSGGRRGILLSRPSPRAEVKNCRTQQQSRRARAWDHWRQAGSIEQS